MLYSKSQLEEVLFNNNRLTLNNDLSIYLNKNLYYQLFYKCCPILVSDDIDIIFNKVYNLIHRNKF